MRAILLTIILSSLSFTYIAAQSCDCSPKPENALINTYEMVISCMVRTDEDLSDGKPYDINFQDVIALIDTTGLNYSATTINPTKFMHPDWNIETLGNIYFTEFDNQGNIYAGASEWKGGFSYSQLGSLGGAGAIYKLDSVTGNPTVLTNLPQSTTPGAARDIGGLSYDVNTNSLYAVNRADDTIYQINICSGAIIDTYPIDLGLSYREDLPDFPFKRKPFAIDIYDGRLYYNVHDFRENGFNYVRSVSLNPTTGNFGSDDQVEIEEAFEKINAVNTIISGDIDFNSNGDLLIGSFTGNPIYYLTSGQGTFYNHQAGNYIFKKVSGSWTKTNVTTVGQELIIGVPNGSSTGGVAWNLDPGNTDIAWMTGGDFKNEDSNWGVIGYNSTKLDSPTISSQEDNPDYIQFLYAGDPGNSNYDPKGLGGEVDVYDENLSCKEKVRIGNYVWIDDNSDGLQDGTDILAVGVTVTLYDATGTTAIATTLTNSLGEYYFDETTGVVPNTSYKIILDNSADFTSGGPLAGYVLTSLDSGTDNSVDSDAILMAGMPAIIVESPDVYKEDLTFDFGFIEMVEPTASPTAQPTASPTETPIQTPTPNPTPPIPTLTPIPSPTPNPDPGKVRIGDYIWYDVNKDGIQNQAELVIPGVTVNLYDSAQNLVQTTTTNSNGRYYFDVSANTDFTIKLDNTSDFNSGSVLHNFILTLTNSGNDAADSDGTLMNGFPAIMIKSPNTGEDLTFDFGFYGINKKTEQIALDSLTAVVSQSNVSLAKTLLKSCKNINKEYVNKKLNRSIDLYHDVWNMVWVDLRSEVNLDCPIYDNKSVKRKIKAKLKRLNYIKKRLLRRSCSESKKRVKKLKRKINSLIKEINNNLIEIPDYINACK